MQLKIKTVKGNFTANSGKSDLTGKNINPPFLTNTGGVGLQTKYFVDISIAGA